MYDIDTDRVKMERLKRARLSGWGKTVGVKTVKKIVFFVLHK